MRSLLALSVAALLSAPAFAAPQTFGKPLAGLSPTTLAAVLELAIETSKPAHTLHRLCWLDAGFRVGSASLVGVSHLGPVDKAEPAVLGSAVLSTFTTLHRGRREDRYPYFKPMNPWEASP